FSVATIVGSLHPALAPGVVFDEVGKEQDEHAGAHPHVGELRELTEAGHQATASRETTLRVASFSTGATRMCPATGYSLMRSARSAFCCLLSSSGGVWTSASWHSSPSGQTPNCWIHSSTAFASRSRAATMRS